MATQEPEEAGRKGGERPCPICNKPATLAYRPFCCKRCADVDLARWLGGRYAIPGATADDADDGEAAGQADPRYL